MDTELLKTFLEVKNTRHFGKAAENLYLTQAAVSARIKQLERLLGAQLFTRYRNNLQLTVTGERLVNHAEAILIAWERARQDVSLKPDQKHVITLGATNGLWDLCLQQALSVMYERLDNLAVRAEAHGQEVLVRRLMERTMDLALMYEPAKITDLETREIARSELVLVSTLTEPNLESVLSDNYVSVDWGMSFNITYAHFFQDSPPPLLHTTLARIALDFILTHGGAAYLPLKMVEQFLGKQLFQVPDAPVIQRPIYVTYHKETVHTNIIQDLIDIIASIAIPNVELQSQVRYSDEDGSADNLPTIEPAG